MVARREERLVLAISCHFGGGEVILEPVMNFLVKIYIRIVK